MDLAELVCDGRLYPCYVPGQPHVVVHLGRAEARKGRPPALFAVCPHGDRLGECQPVPEDQAPRKRRRRKPRRTDSEWCERCKTYLDHLNDKARTAAKV